ncbi:MAG: lysophospholipid acyltransferase family protein [Magnetospiraceae bacterium]
MGFSPLRATFNAAAALAATGVLVPVFLVTAPFSKKMDRSLRKSWCAIMCRLAGLSVQVSGQPVAGKGAFLVGNHISYLDIPVIAYAADLVFVAKSDVASWPIFGFLAKITRTLFVERDPAKAREQGPVLANRIAEGDPVLVFAEGTSTDGLAVAPFKSSLFQVAKGAEAPPPVQPITIAYTRERDGTPLSPERRDHYAWYGDMTLAPHLWNVLGQKGAVVRITFHPVLQPGDFQNRKTLAAHCYQTISEELTRLNAGHLG